MVFNIAGRSSITGLYIGDRRITACQLTKTRKGFNIKKIALLEIDYGILNRRVIIDHDRLSSLITNFFSDNNLHHRNVALSLRGFFITFKRISMEKLRYKDLKKRIFSEAEKHIPFDLQDVYLDFQILNESDKDRRKTMEVLLVAAKRDIVDSYIALLKNSAVKPSIIDVDIFALYNAYLLNYGISNKMILLMDINYNRTLFIVITDGIPLYLLEISVEYPYDINEQFEYKTEQWRLKIKNAIELFYSEYPEESIDEVVLSGECANFEQIKRFAGNIVRNIVLFDPFKRININNDLFGSSYIKKITPHVSICIGLASRNFH